MFFTPVFRAASPQDNFSRFVLASSWSQNRQGTKKNWFGMVSMFPSLFDLILDRFLILGTPDGQPFLPPNKSISKITGSYFGYPGLLTFLSFLSSTNPEIASVKLNKSMDIPPESAHPDPICLKSIQINPDPKSVSPAIQKSQSGNINYTQS